MKLDKNNKPMEEEEEEEEMDRLLQEIPNATSESLPFRMRHAPIVDPHTRLPMYAHFHMASSSSSDASSSSSSSPTSPIDGHVSARIDELDVLARLQSMHLRSDPTGPDPFVLHHLRRCYSQSAAAAAVHRPFRFPGPHSPNPDPLRSAFYNCDESFVMEGRRMNLDTGNKKRGDGFNPMKLESLADAEGYIYHIAKDQNGCRLLQRKFEEGRRQDVDLIFNGIISHVAELMMNPFGNYLVQKLLDVCTEEQRMRVVLKLTQNPSEIIRVSLNTHG